MTKPKEFFKIAVSGDLGSGKSTICKLLQKELTFNVFSMGEAWRRLAAKYNMTILELNKYSETHPLDEEMDQAMAAMKNEPQNIIFDSRLAWYFIPDSFKVHLTVNPFIAAERIFHDKRGEAEGYADINEAFEKINQRKTSENNRYIHKYGIDCSRFNNYDLVVDTSHATPEIITVLIIAKYNAWTNGQNIERHWLSPKTPLPTHDCRSLDQKLVHSIAGSFSAVSFIETNPIDVLENDGYYYIYDGHYRISAALLKEIDFIPAKILACNEEKTPNNETLDFLRKAYNLQNIHRWENLHHFKYPSYPEF